MEYSNLFVVLMGICTVFIGLICIIIIVSIMSSVCRKLAKPQPVQASSSDSVQQEFSPAVVAAISAAIAQELNVGISTIRIKSIKKYEV